LSELVGPRSSGRTSLLLRLMAAATARGELVALVDALDMFDAGSAAGRRHRSHRLLWIRGHVVSNPGLCRDLNQRAIEQAVKAFTLVLQAGNFGLVALDAGEAPAHAMRRLPFTTWVPLAANGRRQPDGKRGRRLGTDGAQFGGTDAQAGDSDPRFGIRFSGRLFDGLHIDARHRRCARPLLRASKALGPREQSESAPAARWGVAHANEMDERRSASGRDSLEPAKALG